MDKEKNVVLVLGLKGSGKSYASKMYRDKYPNSTVISFAGPLRTILFNSIGYSDSKNFNYSDFKESTLVIKNGLFKNKKMNTGRQALQKFGSMMKSMFGNNVWSDIWYKNVLSYDGNVITDDLRFPEEVLTALKLTRHGYKVHFVWSCYEGNDYTEAMKDTHESEALAQFIYRNQDKYGIHDLSVIGHKLMRQILSDFKNSKELLQ